MSKLILSTSLATTILFASSSAMAGQIDGAVNADNRFTVAVTQNQAVFSRYDSPSNYTWGNTQKFSLKTPDNLEECRVNVIVWGDNAVREGFAGVLRGDNGNIYTGGTGSNGFASATESASLSGGFSSLPTNPEIVAMTPLPSGTGPIGSTPSDISNPVWGPASGFYQGSDFTSGTVPTDMAWIKPQNTGNTTNRHWVFSSPCDEIVKPITYDMPGEHFQCYNLEKGDRLKPEPIVIKDQFGKSEVVLGKPRMLCNPSTKIHNDKQYDIRNNERHLVCYDYVKQDRVRQQNLKINNQFAPDDVVSTERSMFCVPSSKTHNDKKPNLGDTRIDRRRLERGRPEPIQQRR